MPCSTNTKQTYPTLLLQQIARNTCAIASSQAGDVNSVAGTANQIAASSPTGAVTLSLEGPHAFSTLTATAVLLGNATSPIAASNMTYVTPVLTVPASFAITGAGSLAFNAGGTNQNITLTPSGTGNVLVGSTANGGGIILTGIANAVGLSSSAGSGQGFFFDTAVNNNRPYMQGFSNVDLRAWNGSAYTTALRVIGGGSLNVLLGTTTDSSNGRLQLATHTTAAGGIGFGTDVSLFRVAADRLATPDLFQANGLSSGVTSTATAAATTTLTATSSVVQIFTGATTQTVQLPAANVLGANVGLWYVIKNRSSGVVTVQRAGADLIDGATTLALATNDSVTFISDGSALWTAN